MTEPNKSSGLDALIQQAKDNCDRIGACPRHQFVPVIKDGQPVGVKCSKCGGEMTNFSHGIYLQGVRDGSQ